MTITPDWPAIKLSSLHPNHYPPPSEEKIAPLAINPLTIPAIITPYGVVAILITTSQAEGNMARQIGIFTLLLLIIVLNWLGMTFAKEIIQKINIISLIIIGWVFAVLQAGLAIDIMLEGLKRAKIIIFDS